MILPKVKQIISVFILLSISQLAISQKTILWKVTDESGQYTSYVVGSFHQFGNSFIDSIPAIKAALIQSELAVFESIDKLESTREMIEQREVSLEIDKKLRGKDLKKLKLVTKDWKVNLYKLKPIEVRWKLEQEIQKMKCKTSLPTDEFDHFDSYLIHLAEQNNIALLGLETDSEQLNMIEEEHKSPDWKKERKVIMKLVNLMLSEKTDDFDCSFADKYRQFDLDYAFDEDCKTTVLNSQRNDEWMKTLPGLLRTKNIFVTLGYLHLKKQCGILEQLKNEGFKIEPVNIH